MFLDTWMAGGLGRAQGPFDEMVFRSMVLDGSRFYDPLGLAAELTKTDFQVEANSYLYGTRFMNYLAYTYTPESLIRWTSTDERLEGVLRVGASSRCTGCRSSRPGATGSPSSRRSSARTSPTIREHPTTPYRDVSREALGSLSRAYVDPERRTDLRRPELSGHCRLHRRDRAGRWPRRAPAGHQAAAHLHGHVACLRPGDAARCSTPPTTPPIATSIALDVTTQTAADAAEGRAHRRAVVQPRRTDRCGASGRSTASARWCEFPHPYTDWNAIYSWPYGEVAYDLDVSPDGQTGVGVGRRDQRQADRARHEDGVAADRTIATPVKQFDFGTAIPSNFVFSPDRQLSVWQLVLHRRVQHLSLRARDR